MVMKSPLIPGGCILVARKITDSEIWEKPPLYLKVWLFLLTKAQHSEYKGLKRGQLLTSIPDIIEGVSWKVGARVERPTKDQVFQALEFLRGKAMKSQRSPHGELMKATTNAMTKATMITTTKATHNILITIDNYGVYQDFRNYEGNGEHEAETDDASNAEEDAKATRRQRPPDNINKNVKNVKNDVLKDLSADIQNLRSRYSSELVLIIESYLDFIGNTRKAKLLSDKAVLKIYDYFAKYSTSRIEYAIRTHMGNPEYSKAKEEYTFGILRNTSEQEAERKLPSLRGEESPAQGKKAVFDPDEYLASLREDEKSP
jgi:hypothetical protein